jgi:hypothetical protein
MLRDSNNNSEMGHVGGGKKAGHAKASSQTPILNLSFF